MITVTKEGVESQYWKLQQICLEVAYSQITREESDLMVEGQKQDFCFHWHLRTQLAEEIGKKVEAYVIKTHYRHLQKSTGKDLQFGKVSTLVIFSDITCKRNNLIPIFLLIADFLQ